MGQFFFSLALIVLLLVLYLWMSRAGIAVIEPAKLFLISFAIGFSLLFSHSVVRLHGPDYYSTFTFKTGLFMAASFLFFSIGALIGTRAATARMPERSFEPYNRNGPITSALAGGTILYIVLVLQELATSPASIFTGASIYVLRQIAQAQEVESQVGAIDLVFSLSRTSLLLFLVIVIFQQKEIGRLLKILAYVGGGVLVIEALSSGARSAMAFVPLFLGLAASLKLYEVRMTEGGRLVGLMKRSPVRWYSVVAGMFLVYILFVAFPLSRNPNLVKNFEFFLSLSHPSEFGWWVNGLSTITYFESVKALAYGTQYLSLGITKLSYFIENTDLSSLHSLGYYNAKVLVRFASVFDPSLYDRWLDIREAVGDAMAMQGLNENPWRSIMGDLLLDFGLFGTPVFLFAMGFTFQFWFRRLVCKQEAAASSLAVLLCATCAVCGFFGPFANNNLAYPLVLLSLLMGIWRLMKLAADGEQKQRRRMSYF